MRKKIFITLTVITVAITAVIGVGIASEHNKSTQLRKVSDAFVANVLADKPDATYAKFTNATKQNESVTAWTGVVDKVSAFFHGSSAVYHSTSVSASDTEVDYSIAGIDGKYTFKVLMKSVSGTWQVVSFTSVRNNG